MKTALTIAGFDPCGGAGLQADLKTFQALGVYGLSTVTAITVQNTQKVFAVEKIKPQIVHDQIKRLFEDMTINAVKIGMLTDNETIIAIATALNNIKQPPLVLDPVLKSSGGCPLLEPDAQTALIQHLLPLADVITPNTEEAAALTNQPVTDIAGMHTAAQKIADMGSSKVVIKGGHLPHDQCIDLLYDGKTFTQLAGPRLPIAATHGTGCTFAAAIAALLAQGRSFLYAVSNAKRYVTNAMKHSLTLGQGQNLIHCAHNWHHN